MHWLWVMLVTGPDGRWRPGIGDPTVMGWVTVFAYFTAACAAFAASHAAKKGKKAARARDPRAAANFAVVARFWLLACGVMVLLGINKQLDLQSLFTEIGRDISVAQGWYEKRRSVQWWFVRAVVLLGTGTTLALAYSVRRVLWRVLGGVMGLGIIVSFVVIRAASFHHFDLVLYGPHHLNWVLELSGIGVVLLSAVWATRKETVLGRVCS